MSPHSAGSLQPLPLQMSQLADDAVSSQGLPAPFSDVGEVEGVKERRQLDRNQRGTKGKNSPGKRSLDRRLRHGVGESVAEKNPSGHRAHSRPGWAPDPLMGWWDSACASHPGVLGSIPKRWAQG